MSVYVIAMLPRTGSTALCSLLSQTQCLGNPDEYLNPRGPLQYWTEHLAVEDIDDYLEKIQDKQATTNGVFGLKTTYHDFRSFDEKSLVCGKFKDAKFVYLTRDDIAAQAVSEFLAEESGVWHRDSSGSVYRSKAIKEVSGVAFDERRIMEIVSYLEQSQQSWEAFFALYAIEPLRISYEEVCSDANDVVARIARHLGIEWVGNVSLERAATSKMSDHRSAEWAEHIRTKASESWNAPNS